MYEPKKHRIIIDRVITIYRKFQKLIIKKKRKKSRIFKQVLDYGIAVENNKKYRPNVHANLDFLNDLGMFLVLLIGVARIELKTYGLRYCPRTWLSTSNGELFLNKHQWPQRLFDFYITRVISATPSGSSWTKRPGGYGSSNEKDFLLLCRTQVWGLVPLRVLPGPCRLLHGASLRTTRYQT